MQRVQHSQVAFPWNAKPFRRAKRDEAFDQKLSTVALHFRSPVMRDARTLPPNVRRGNHLFQMGMRAGDWIAEMAWRCLNVFAGVYGKRQKHGLAAG